MPKSPPTEPSIKQLAVMVEDHPLEYIDFSGQIPEGLYSAGSVDIWTRGEYQLHARDANRLSFTLRGAKLQGPHVLELEYSPYQQDCQFPKTQEVVFACG